jgi:branched-chain amino acid transport system ATP-binding protein
MTAAPEPLLSVAGVGVSFGGVVALNDISFDILPGELFAIIGPNGAGKTTMLNCLSGLYRPNAACGIARTFQNLGLFANLSVLHNILLGRHCRTRSGFIANALRLGSARREEAVQRDLAERTIELLDLGDYRDRAVGTLPYGVRKLVELGRALVMEPKLLLLDEPAAGMNLEETEDFAVHVQDIRERTEVAVLLVEHDMALVMDLADRIMVIDFGVPIATGTPQEIQAHEGVIRAYLGGGLGDPAATSAGAP